MDKIQLSLKGELVDADKRESKLACSEWGCITPATHIKLDQAMLGSQRMLISLPLCRVHGERFKREREAEIKRHPVNRAWRE